MNESRAHQLSPHRTVVTSFTPRQRPTSAPDISPGGTTYYDDGDWVLFVESNPSYISCALSNGEIQVFDPRRLHTIQSYKNVHGDEGVTTDLVGAPPQHHSDHILASSGTDGKVHILDIRQATPTPITFQMPHAREQALSVSLGYDGNLAAVGSSKSKIHFYDVRQPITPLGSYVNSHTDEVTRVRFQHTPQYTFSSSASATGSVLVSGSEDGLCCIFDTTQPSEEAALKSVMNNQASIRNVGFFGPNLEGIYCLTGSETMMLWSCETAECLANYSDIRGLLQVDYLVNANWDPSRKELVILAGCNNGDACLSSLSVAATTGRPPLITSHRMMGGHRGVVRDWCPLSGGSMFVTVGEDARMCEWNLTGRQSNAVPKVSSSSSNTKTTAQTSIMARRDSGNNNSAAEVMSRRNSGGGPVRRLRQKRSVTPY